MTHPTSSVRERLKALLASMRKQIASGLGTAFPGIAHRQRLTSIDTRIVVSGTRGKSSLTRWLYEIFRSRDQDVYAKVTGNRPVSLYNGETHPIEREKQVRLYENERELRKYTPEDTAIVENQAISSYTNRVVNEFFTQADVVVLSNIREDHLSTLGNDRYKIARSLVRAVPPGAHVVNGERDPHLRKYIDEEVKRRDATISHVTVPSEYAHVPGIESVYALNHVLAVTGHSPLDEDELKSYREQMNVDWTPLENGAVFNAAEVNDVQSTEIVRQALTKETDTTIQPFLYLRGDRRGRTASFLHYLEGLAGREEAAFETVHVAGPMADVFQRKASFPVVVHEIEKEDAGSVLDDLLAVGYPVMLMGNTVAEFMRDMEEEITTRHHNFIAQKSGSLTADTNSQESVSESGIEANSSENETSASGDPSRYTR